MRTQYDCSVIIPTYNRRDLLRYTLGALAQQTLQRSRYEVIVVDDGSSDDSEAVAQTFAGRLNLTYVFQEDRGFRVAKARNEGILRAQGRICVFVDSGVIPHSAALASHLHTHGERTRAAVCGYVYGFNQDNEDAATIRRLVDPMDPDASIARLAELNEFSDVREVFYRRYGDSFSHLRAPWVVYWTCNVSARRDHLVQVGMFDENYQSWGVEDVDLGYRLFHAGAEFVLNRKASALHYPHEKRHEVNTTTSSGNYEYFSQKFHDPICDLVPRCKFFELNDLADRTLSVRSSERIESARLVHHARATDVKGGSDGA